MLPVDRLRVLEADYQTAYRGDAKRMKHVVLLGDSVFDNGAYVGSSPALVHQLHQLLPGGWAANLNARDGAVIAEIRHQLQKLPPGGDPPGDQRWGKRRADADGCAGSK